MKNSLKQLYTQWSDELLNYCSTLVDGEYSNPYYVNIPNDWEHAQQRIMIVGEEGFGKWGCGKVYGWKKQDPAYTIKNIEEIQIYNTWAITTYTKQNKTPFWRRFKKIKDLGFPCIWNNLDKVHSLIKRNGLKHQLSKAEEQLLHSTPTKILQKEIEILKPTIVVFFGWYYESLRAELPEISQLLYPKGKNDDSPWKYTVYSIEKDNVTYIFTYHPGWRKKPQNYEESVINEVIKAINN